MDSNQIAAYSPIFSPKNIAVFYQSKDKFNRGTLAIKSLLFFGFKGKIYPINKHEKQIQGLTVYPSLDSIPDKLDLVILDVQDTLLIEVALECACHGVKGVVVTTNIEFHESNKTEYECRQIIIKSLTHHNTRLLGPVSSGIYSPSAGLTSCLGDGLSPEPGPTGIFAEQGLEISDICYASMGRGVQFSTVVSVGRGWDIDAVEMLRYFAADNKTRIIGGYIDEISNGSALEASLRQCSKIKPTVIFHPVSPCNAESSIKIPSADFIRSTGAIHTSSFHDFVDCLMVLNCLEYFNGTNAGLIAEEKIYCPEGERAAIDHGFFIPKLDKYSLDKIKETTMSKHSYNLNSFEPGMKQPGNMWVFTVLDVLFQNPAIDFVVMQQPTRISWFQQKTFQHASVGDDSDADFTSALIKKAKEIYKTSDKHLIMILPETSIRADSVKEIEDRLVSRKQFCTNGIPCFDSFEQAFSVLGIIKNNFT